MRSSVDDVPIEYTVLKASEAAPMARMLAETFCRRDPPAVAVGLAPSDFEAFVHLLCPKAVVEELTIVARRADTGELVGALLTEDGASGLPEGMDGLNPKFAPIFDILGELDAAYGRDRAPCPGDSLHLYLLGVAQSASGRSVAQRLVSTCLENASRKRYRRATTEATNKVSQHIFRKLGFVDRVSRSYAEHRFEGRAPFASIADQGGPILMDRALAVPSRSRLP
jgi:ribosomal protein S18 acetylase RimI-like enzyme